MCVCARGDLLFYACCIDFSVNLFPTMNCTPNHDDDWKKEQQANISTFFVLFVLSFGEARGLKIINLPFAVL